MASVEVLITVVFIVVAGLSVLARWLGIPYPILLVLGGLALGFSPGIPDVELDPKLVLLGFLPPLLYSAAFFADLRALRDDLRAISLTAIGLVLLTTVTVAVVAHAMIEELSWAAAFALGAIVSPTDPIAATAIMRRLGAPRRVVNVIEGESLVNDASALVAYRVAIGVAVGGSFSLLDERVGRMYDWRRRRFAARAGVITDEGYDDRSLAYQRVMRELYQAQRRVLVRMRNEGRISNDLMHRLERELDLEESRLEI